MDNQDPNLQAHVTWLTQQLQEMSTALAAMSAAAQTKPAPTAHLKVKTPKVFRGDKTDRWEIRSWLYGVEGFYNTSRVDDDNVRLSYVRNVLEGDARIWWRAREDAADAGGQPMPTSWAEFCSDITAQFEPANAKAVIRTRFYDLRQTGSVQMYVATYRSLLLNLLDVSTEDRLARFMHGLKTDVQVQVEISKPANLDQAIATAERIDTLTFRPSARRPAYPSSSYNGPVPMELGAMDDEECEDADEWEETDEDAFQLAAATMGNSVGRRPSAPTSGRRPSSSAPPSSAPRRGVPLTTAEKDYARAQGLCWTCMKPGHTSFNCPLKTGHPKGGPPPS